MRLPEPLRSASHPLARQVRLLGKGLRERRAEGLFLVEGPRGVAEALAAHAALVFVLVGARRMEEASHAELVAQCLKRQVPVQPVQDALLDRLVPSEHGPGLAAACRLPRSADEPREVLQTTDSGLLVVSWQLQNPGNLGALVRSGAAFGARGLLAAGGADPWNPKAVRASAGAIHRLPVARAEDPEAALSETRSAGFTLVAASARGGVSPDKIDWSRRVAVLIGGEVAGLPPEVEAAATLVTIATTGLVESLSAPIAGAILLQHAFERARR